jgi:hypothetical protein
VSDRLHRRRLQQLQGAEDSGSYTGPACSASRSAIRRLIAEHRLAAWR